MAVLNIKIRELDTDDFFYSFQLSLEDVVDLATMPYMNRGDKSKREIKDGKITLFRFAEKLSLVYDNPNSINKRTVFIQKPYSQLEKLLFQIVEELKKGKNKELILDCKKEKTNIAP